MQLVQSLAPLESEKVPDGQDTQLVAAASEYFPGLQSEHSDAATIAPYAPAMHSVHCDSPCVGE